jgi:hypothetical protein
MNGIQFILGSWRGNALGREANRAFAAGHAEGLQLILDEYQDGADVVEGEGIGAELIPSSVLCSKANRS